MKRFYFFIVVMLFAGSLHAQSIRYQFSAPNAAHHEAEISLTVDKLPAGPAYFSMSRSSPGRYAKHEFGKNVYNVNAVDETGKPLQVEKADADIYTVLKHKGKVTLTYTLYANYADGTYSLVDRTGYHLNMPATFMWVKGLEKAPIYLHFVMDKNWKTATQLKQDGDVQTFFAPDLQYFMDSPVIVGNLQFRQWTVTNPDKKQTIFKVALAGETTTAVFDLFAKKVERMVNEAKAVFGEVPAYEYGSYTFLASINPYVKGDGMEHRNSTMITLPVNFDGSNGLLGVFSHEFFHCWNVERIRPADIEPFNFSKSNMSEGLWLAEGFTQYYGNLILRRANLQTADDFLNKMSGLVNTKMNTPGAQNYSPIENSQRAVFVDAGVSIDQNNYQNMYTSYYTYGGALALALDLSIRSQFKQVSLDDFMRQLWLRFGKTGKPYTVNDLQPALAAITNTAFAANFFEKYIFGHEAFDYATALTNAGIGLKKVSPNKAWPGKISFTGTSGGLTISGNTIINSPIYKTGADIGDVIVSLDGKSIATRSDFNGIINAHKPGDNIHIRYSHRGVMVDSTLLLSEDPEVILQAENDALTSQQKQFETLWLASKAGDQ